MKLDVTADGTEFHHDVRASFGELLRAALNGSTVLVGHGPVYPDDPAAEVLAPFVTSARESGWDFDESAVPEWVIGKARQLRVAPIVKELWELKIDMERVREIDRWTRAGLVLEIARRRGVNVSGRYHHVPWKLCGTMTGRFGVEPGATFNPLVIPADRRHQIRPSDAVRHIVVIDFRAIDLCSMVSILPEVGALYGDAVDMHGRTAELTGLDRATAKAQIFVHAYGGNSPHRGTFERVLPAVLSTVRGPELAQLVQATSAKAFRGALSNVLPLLTDMHFIPMFTVHDEVVLDVSEVGLDRIQTVTKALEEGASQTIGRPYRVRVSTGYTYEEAKR